MRRLEFVGCGWGTVFCCYLQSLYDLLVTESGCSDNDGADKLFWGIKKLFLLFFGGNFLVILSANANANIIVCFEMKSREVDRMQLTNQVPRNKTL